VPGSRPAPAVPPDMASPERMARGAFEASLPRAAYVDETFLDRERDVIWWAEWVAVGRVEQLVSAGDFLALDVAGERVIVVRDRVGALHAHYDLCRHRGSRLTTADQRAEPVSGDPRGPTGTFKGVIRCGYHSWCYELDGRVRNAPFLGETAAFDPSAFGLHPVALETWGGWIFVNLSPERVAAGHTLVVQLGGIPDRLVRYPLADLLAARRLVYSVHANWKVIVENYNECYHCAGVHPALCRIVPAFRQRGGSNLDWDAGIPQAEGTFTFTATGTSDRAPFPGLDGDERVRHKGELAYPNLMISLSADHVTAFTLLPVAADRTRIVVDFLFHPDEIAKPTFDPSDAVEFWDLVNRQDWAVCEGVQDGMTSRRFRFGWYAPMEDLSLDIRRYLGGRLGPDAVAAEIGADPGAGA
jgi:phenylpropionate dioxygenase-like ring-hydroxylating dioxygenase large terminal subunit